VSAASGSHQLIVNAWDSAGTLYHTSESFSVGTGGGTTCTPPTSAGVTVCAPANGVSVTSPVTITAYANGGTKSITAMRAYVDGQQVAASGSGTLNASITIAAGAHTFIVNAWNSSGTLYKYSGTFTVQ
jgi:hypothetical protein